MVLRGATIAVINYEFIFSATKIISAAVSIFGCCNNFSCNNYFRMPYWGPLKWGKYVIINQSNR
ncbi:hypothetical protein C2G38_2245603 [Gigaspora rosea]|uniref:Uncharacterized protein n=1 Tax=Gigaspora rosea TaxID=44941 RepID=A0A397V8E8_9GLOM|nr:hypothetical protein C2G38_2245603 [Gigaspora rosea]